MTTLLISGLLRVMVGLGVVAVTYGVILGVTLLGLGVHWFVYQEWASVVVIGLMAAAFGAGVVGASVKVSK